jgi:hypothetical protein
VYSKCRGSIRAFANQTAEGKDWLAFHGLMIGAVSIIRGVDDGEVFETPREGVDPAHSSLCYFSPPMIGGKPSIAFVTKLCESVFRYMPEDNGEFAGLDQGP